MTRIESSWRTRLSLSPLLNRTENEEANKIRSLDLQLTFLFALSFLTAQQTALLKGQIGSRATSLLVLREPLRLVR
jgi:hypothetical protein